jgi:hypothetical protein
VQKLRADRRAEWWRRVQWAVDQANAPDAHAQAVGILTMADFLSSRLATEDDLALLRELSKSVLGRERP